jgi:hypothetical protein
MGRKKKKQRKLVAGTALNRALCGTKHYSSQLQVLLSTRCNVDTDVTFRTKAEQQNAMTTYVQHTCSKSPRACHYAAQLWLPNGKQANITRKSLLKSDAILNT